MALADGRITKQQHAALLARADAATARRARESQGLIRVSKAMNGEGETLDPDADEDRAAADRFWAALSVPRADTDAVADADAQRAMAVDFVRATGVVPETIRNQL
ncbi:MAG: hypothetical protein QNJ92_18460, partial [Alphaproteobacteria bacterium]|nr:hypothetical protein [Alphaproteobacteria bacterium]